MTSNPPTENPDLIEPDCSIVTWRICLVLMAEVFAIMAFTTPNESFARWGFLDSGADLSIQAMIARGLRPTIDFGYIHGLLPLGIGKIWQSCFGANPTACRGATLVCHLALACGLGRLASTMRVGIAGVALMMVAMPDMLMTSTSVLVHVLEPALLLNALAYQASGRRSMALVLATVCLFNTPTMAYLYALVLVVQILAIDRRSAWRTLLPAAITGLFLASALALWYGPIPLVRTLIPGGGMTVYQANHYGFFNEAGRQFWLLPGAGIRDYFRDQVGGWILAAIGLSIGGCAGLLRIVRRRAVPADPMMLTCALLHAGFVLGFFGNRDSWIYDYSILIAGVAVIAALDWQHALAIVVLTIIVLAGNKVKTRMSLDMWSTHRPSSATYGLWATDAQREEWIVARELIKRFGPAALLATAEGATVLAPDLFLPAECSYLVEGHTISTEVSRKAKQVAEAKMVVCTRDPAGLGYWPEIISALDGCSLVRKSGMFWVLRRDRPPSSSK